jgi:hypothetical protein
MSDVNRFGRQLDQAYQDKVLGTLSQAVRKVALTVDRELVLKTPVDTGRARSNWIPSLDAPSVKIVEPGQKPDIQDDLAQYTVDKTVFITNNLPYIRRLNEGHSDQAPAGFVDDAVQKGKNSI